MMDLWQAKKIVDRAQGIALHDASRLPEITGLCLTNSPITHLEYFERIWGILGRDFPHRYEFGGKLFVELGASNRVLVAGNEEENDINGEPKGISHWLGLLDQAHAVNKMEYNSELKVGCPALMTLKQGRGFWKQCIAHEDEIDYWCVNSHFPGFIKRPESGLGTYWERIKCVAEMLKFRRAIKKPVIITECGSGQFHYSQTPADVIYGYWIHRLIFLDKLVAVLYYDSDLMFRCNGYDVIKKR